LYTVSPDKMNYATKADDNKAYLAFSVHSTLHGMAGASLFTATVQYLDHY